MTGTALILLTESQTPILVGVNSKQFPSNLPDGRDYLLGEGGGFVYKINDRHPHNNVEFPLKFVL